MRKKLLFLMLLLLSMTLLSCSISRVEESETKTEDNTTTPEEITPDKTTPEESTPDKTPDETTPEESTPDKTPEETTPEETTPEESTPDETTTLTVKDVYDLTEGSKVVVNGKVTGLLDNQFYFSDDSKTILVYLGKQKLTDFPEVKLNKDLEITAILGSYNGNLQLKDIKEVTTSSKTFNPDFKTLNDVSDNYLKANMHQGFNVSKAIIKKLPKPGFKDTSIEVTINNQKIEIFLSYHLEKASREAINTSLKGLKTNDAIKVSNLYVSYFKHYQLTAVNDTVFEKIEPKKESLGIAFDRNLYQINVNTKLEDLLSKVEVYEEFDDGSKVLIPSDKYSVDTKAFDSSKVGNEFSLTYTYKLYTKTLKVKVIDPSTAVDQVFLDKALYKDVLSKPGFEYFHEGLPSVGSPKALVIPVEFKDYKAKPTMLKNLETAFNGTSTQTGWESLNSYYLKSSYNNLNVTGELMPLYSSPYTTKQIEKMNTDYWDALDNYNHMIEIGKNPGELPLSPQEQIISEALRINDKNYNYQDYDSNSDGYIDGVYIIYTCPQKYHNDSDSWWAWTTTCSDCDIIKDNVKAGMYCFMSYEFFFEPLYGLDVSLNCETLIHESGHMLGLDDYYDYDSSDGDNGTAGIIDMMEQNCGDHNSFSKTYLGWTNPYVTKGVDATLTLRSFGSTGDTLIIPKKFDGNLLSEYFIVEYFTPDGLNEAVSHNSDYYGFTIPGIRIFHIDATLGSPNDAYFLCDILKYNNSNTSHQLIKFEEKNTLFPVSPNYPAEDDDLYQKGDTFTSKWYDGKNCGFELVVNSTSKTEANISVIYK